jgi:ABC-type glycerol-3-phosphate transport system substrate-binding protein
MWTHDDLTMHFFLRRAKEWAKKYPQYTFTFDFVVVPYNDLFTKVLANLAAGTGAPDIVGIEISAFSRFMHGNIAQKGLVNLTPYIGAERHLFVEGRWTPYMVNGRIYGVECALCPVGLYYRQDLFQKAGIATPLATYADVVAAGRILAKDNTYAFMAPTGDVTIFMEIFQQVGGQIFDASGKLTLDDPRAVQVLEFLVNGAKQKIFWAGPDPYGAPVIAALKLGKIASVLMPDWYSADFLEINVKEQAGKWRLQTMPTWSTGGRRVSTWGGTGFAVTTQSKHPDLAFSLVHFTFMDEVNQVKRFQEIRFFPTRKEAFHDPGVTQVPDPYFGGQKIGGVFASVADQVPLQYQSPYWNEAITALTNEYTNAMIGKKTPAQAIKDATAAIAKLMAKGF